MENRQIRDNEIATTIEHWDDVEVARKACWYFMGQVRVILFKRGERRDARNLVTALRPADYEECDDERARVPLNPEQAKLLGRVCVWSADFAERRDPVTYFRRERDFKRMREIASNLEQGVQSIVAPRFDETRRLEFADRRRAANEASTIPVNQ